jgi:hypothetical protein
VHDRRLVFDDDDRVSAVAETVEDPDEAVGVAGMQADGGFVEHVEGVDQAGAEAGGEVDPFGFTA